VDARYDRRIARVVVTLSTSLQITFASRTTQGLEHANPADLMDVRITPSGLGLHFPRLDADIYIPALMEGNLGTKSWMATKEGRPPAKSTSQAKIAAARENGKRGGRPRKVKGDESDAAGTIENKD
jgi:hypothetical protein